MPKNSTPLFEFEAMQAGAIYCLRLVRFADLFWLQRMDLEDWLARFEDKEEELQIAFQSSNEAELNSLVLREIQKQRLGRAFCWQENSPIFVTWTNSNHFWFNADNQEFQVFSSQTLWYEKPFWTTPGTVFRQRFRKEWRNLHSDVRDALEHLLDSPKERGHVPMVWLNGSWDEVQQVLSAALNIEFDEAATLSQQFKFEDIVTNFSLPISHELWLGWVLHVSGSHSAPSERLQRLLFLIDARNIRDLDQEHGMFEVEVRVSISSMHDKIEARLFLQDWLSENAPQLLPDWV